MTFIFVKACRKKLFHIPGTLSSLVRLEQIKWTHKACLLVYFIQQSALKFSQHSPKLNYFAIAAPKNYIVAFVPFFKYL